MSATLVAERWAGRLTGDAPLLALCPTVAEAPAKKGSPGPWLLFRIEEAADRVYVGGERALTVVTLDVFVSGEPGQTSAALAPALDRADVRLTTTAPGVVTGGVVHACVRTQEWRSSEDTPDGRVVRVLGATYELHVTAA